MNYDIEKLLKIKDELNKVSDELTIKFKEFEDDINKLNLGIIAFTHISPNIQIGYTKLDGKWGIVCVFREGPINTDEEITRRWIDCPRTVRLYAYKNRYKLLPALEKTAESLARRMNKAINDIEEEDKESIDD